MRLLLTGSAGYAGRGIAQIINTAHWVRGADVKESAEGVNESVVTDITSLDACMSLVDGVDAVVQCHMAPNPIAYKTPVMAIDVNVKGTANLYHAMAERGITRCVLISSTGVLHQDNGADAVPGDGPYKFGRGLYALTKQMQELVARHYFETSGIITTLLRPAWVVYDEKLITKYGEKMEKYNSGLVDPRDIGTAVLRALELPDPTLEAFNIGQDDLNAQQVRTRGRLKWSPAYNFATLQKD